MISLLLASLIAQSAPQDVPRSAIDPVPCSKVKQDDQGYPIAIPQRVLDRWKNENRKCPGCKRQMLVCRLWESKQLDDECQRITKENRLKWWTSKEGREWRKNELMKKADELKIDIKEFDLK